MSDEIIVEDELIRLSTLSTIEYEQEREAVAKRLGIRVSVLDSEVEKRRVDEHSSGEENSIVEELEPYHEAVDGAELASHIQSTIHQHCVLNSHKTTAITLWTMGSYSYRSFTIFPRLALVSPTMRCGKTTTLSTIELFANRAVSCESITPAVLFRLVEKYSPTLLLDEADTILPNNEDLRGVVNSGHSSRGKILRCVGDNHDPTPFKTFGPLILALIGKLSPTINDRSIGIDLERKLPTQTVQRIKPNAIGRHKTARRKLLKWAEDSKSAMSHEPVDVPKLANDRAIDNWLPLLAVADSLGDEWSEKARQAMLALEAKTDESDDHGTMLLTDICELAKRSNWGEKVPSSKIIDSLNSLEDRVWPTLRNDKGINAHALAKYLKPFGLNNKPKRSGKEVFRGYDLKAIINTRNRYCPETPLIPPSPPNTPEKSDTPLHPSSHAGSSAFISVTGEKGVTLPNTSETASNHRCNGVTVFEGSSDEDAGNCGSGGAI